MGVFIHTTVHRRFCTVRRVKSCILIADVVKFSAICDGRSYNYTIKPGHVKQKFLLHKISTILAASGQFFYYITKGASDQ